MPPVTFDFLRAQTIGIDAPVRTPFGERLLVYADYTASGRMLAFVEDYLREAAVLYANSHTEDSQTGRATTQRLHDAEARIKAHVNAGPDGRLIACGTGSTAAIHKLQEILGIALPPATRARLAEMLPSDAAATFEAALRERRPVVFVGPYEHHSNEVTWREGVAEVVEVDLAADGGLDLDHLETLLTDERYAGRLRIGSFSAASNVTGVRTPVAEVARLLHRHDAFVCFDYAASAPYVGIDMNPNGDPEATLDAVFLSPHKCLGGPGTPGLLVFNERLYPKDLPPSVGGGGTVVYVNRDGHAFIRDVEEREKAGTPGILQTLRAALALEVKDALGIDAIEAREQELLTRALDAWREEPTFRLLGPANPSRRIGIVSFNLGDGAGGMLHPRFVTTLLDDLFGIQSRAGCSCAGPYAHRILGIGARQAARLMALSEDGFHGVKPGWCRVGFHFTMDDAEAEYVIEAVRFVARYGARFLPQYRFHVRNGSWEHAEGRPAVPAFGLDAALAASPERPEPMAEAARRARYAEALDHAEALAAELGDVALVPASLDDELEPFRYFSVAEGTITVGSEDDAFCGGF